MGFLISWLAVEGVGKERMLRTLGLVDTGEPDEANEARFSIADLPTGWCVLWSNDQQFATDRAPRLSHELGPVLSVMVDETCMHMTAAMFDGGEQRWQVHHEGDERIDFLETQGALPEGATAIEARLRSLQIAEDGGSAEVDYLSDVPLEIAKLVCGYKHDETRFNWGEPMFTAVMEASVRSPRTPPSTGRSSFWRRLIEKPS